MMQQEPVIWDRFVRVFHWSLAGCVLLNVSVLRETETVHEWVGYGALSLVILRIFWGFVGSYHARWRSFLPTWSRVQAHLDYMRALRQTPTPTPHPHPHPSNYQGHNPLGALMILTLITWILGLGITGWLQGTDAFFGYEPLRQIHIWLGNSLMGLVVIHITAAIWVGKLERTRLIKAMWTGRKERY